MARSNMTVKRVPNGTYGTVWLDGERLAECYGCQGKIAINSEKLAVCGDFMLQAKAVSGEGTGALMLYKVDSGMLLRMQSIQAGQIPEMTITSKLADPDSDGAERVAYYGVQFTELTLADWQVATVGKITVPYIFTAYQLLDVIPVE